MLPSDGIHLSSDKHANNLTDFLGSRQLPIVPIHRLRWLETKDAVSTASHDDKNVCTR